MIVFACWQCGKHFERPENAAGTLVFCDCGAGVTVPWESAAASPPVPLAIPIEQLPRPQQPEQPMPFPWTAWEAPQTVIAHRDPAFCFNHQRLPSEQTCSQCGEKFCKDCVVVLLGKNYCGPCKNFYLRGLQHPPRVSITAICSPLLALLTAPAALFILVLIGGMGALAAQGGNNSSGVAWVLALFGLLAVLVQAVAFGLGAYSLWHVETNPRLSGRSLAITGLVTALVGGLLVVDFALLFARVVE